MKRRWWVFVVMLLVASLFLIGCDSGQDAADGSGDTADTSGDTDTGDAGGDTTGDAGDTSGDTTGGDAGDSTGAASAPVAMPDNFETTMETAVADNVLANDVDSSGNPVDAAQVTVTIATNVSNGTLQLNTDGSFTYQPNAGYAGADSFRYRVCANADAAACGEADANIMIMDAAAGSTEDGAPADGGSAEGEAGGEDAGAGEPADSAESGDGDMAGSEDAADAGAETPPATADTPGASGGAAPTTITMQGGGTVHVVQELEWLIQIARCYGTTEHALLGANYIPNRHLIYPGQQIVIPSPGNAGAVTGPPCVVYYTTQANDTTTSVAATYGIKESELRRINAIPTSGPLPAGKRLVLPTPVPPIMQP